MVDKGARAACTDTIHALLRRIAEVSDLRVLAAELDDRIRARNQLSHRCCTRNDLLYKGKSDALGDAHTRRARQCERKFLLTDDVL